MAREKCPTKKQASKMDNVWSKIADYACGKSKLSTRSQKLFDDFVKESSLKLTLSELFIPQKPLTSSEKNKKNELQKIKYMAYN